MGRYYSGDGAQPAAPSALGRWKWPAFLLCAVVVIQALLLPAGVLLYWLVRGLASGESLAPLWSAAGNSLLASAAGAGLTLAAALPLVILITRRPSVMTQFAERLAYSGFAVPGIVIALAFIFFGARNTPGLYQTLPVLLIAYAIMFLPQATGALRVSFLQVHPGLEEAARSLGKRPWQVFLRITLPMVRPGVLAGIALVFLTALKELPLTLLLAPFGFKTLSTAVWSAVTEAFFARAAAPALLLILTSSVPLAVLTLREESQQI